MAAGDGAFLEDFVENGFMKCRLLPRGNSGTDGQFAADNAYSVKEGLPSRILMDFQGSFMHQAADGEADLIASVRLRISELLGITAKHLTGDSVRARYADGTASSES